MNKIDAIRINIYKIYNSVLCPKGKLLLTFLEFKKSL